MARENMGPVDFVVESQFQRQASIEKDTFLLGGFRGHCFGRNLKQSSKSGATLCVLPEKCDFRVFCRASLGGSIIASTQSFLGFKIWRSSRLVAWGLWMRVGNIPRFHRKFGIHTYW